MQQQVKVWDPLVRVFHWGLVIGVAVAWYSADRSRVLHEIVGYSAVSLLTVRILWGLFGSRTARFSHFVRHPFAILGYLTDIATGREKRYLGHNPAGGAMILALIAVVAVQGMTGWMMTTDAFFGVRWVETLHKLNFNVLMTLVILHLLGVAVASLRHRENLPLAMITGRKRAPEPNDVA